MAVTTKTRSLNGAESTVHMVGRRSGTIALVVVTVVIAVAIAVSIAISRGGGGDPKGGSDDPLDCTIETHVDAEEGVMESIPNCEP